MSIRPVLRRTMIGALVLAVLTAVAGVLAYTTRAEEEPPVKAPPTGHRPPDAKPERGADGPPSTSDPVAFAEAAAEALWSYDARASSHAAHLATLKRWMSGEEAYADWKSVAGDVPDRQLWARLHDNGQHARAEASEGHVPQAFAAAMEADPGAITDAWVYAVTVTGKQTLAWDGSGAGAERRASTLAVQCRPKQDCRLAGVLPTVAP